VGLLASANQSIHFTFPSPASNRASMSTAGAIDGMP
jgi:hypothetical protein